MAYNFLDKTGLALVWEKIKNLANTKVDKVDGKGLSTNDFTSAEKTKLAGIEAGAQVNVLEGIQKNGSTITPVNKIANISVPTATSELTNDSGFITTADIPEGAAASTTTPLMDGTAAVGTELAFARGDHRHPTDTSRASASDLSALDGRVEDLEEAVGTGGSVDSKIQTAIQGLDSSISAETNKAIASVTVTDGKITASTKVTIPTNTNQLTNGAGFQTASQVTSAIEGYGYQTASDVSSAISSAITTVMDYKGTKATVAQLPSTGNKQGDVWHVTADDGEYAWNGTEWEELGSAMDLSGYVEDTDMVAITSTEINTICV